MQNIGMRARGGRSEVAPDLVRATNVSKDELRAKAIEEREDMVATGEQDASADSFEIMGDENLT